MVRSRSLQFTENYDELWFYFKWVNDLSQKLHGGVLSFGVPPVTILSIDFPALNHPVIGESPIYGNPPDMVLLNYFLDGSELLHQLKDAWTIWNVENHGMLKPPIKLSTAPPKGMVETL